MREVLGGYPRYLCQDRGAVMRLEDVTAAAEQGLTVIHSHMGIQSRCRISGVLTRFDKGKGWTYSLELRDLAADCVIIADLEQVEVQKE